MSVTGVPYCAGMDLVIECDSCIKQDSDACGDCIVAFVVSREPDDAVVFDVAAYAAVKRLQRAGLVADSQHEPQHRPASATGQLDATG